MYRKSWVLYRSNRAITSPSKADCEGVAHDESEPANSGSTSGAVNIRGGADMIFLDRYLNIPGRRGLFTLFEKLTEQIVPPPNLVNKRASRMAIISIALSNSPRSSSGLAELLAAIESGSMDFKWYLVEFEAGYFSKEGGPDDYPDRWIADLHDEIERQRAGVSLPWEKVKDLANLMRPPDMALLIAVKPGVPPPSWPLNIASPRFEIAIQGTDDYCWNVTTRNEAIVTQLKERFRDLQFVG
jgi:hypothetical protein